jgi:hypothetical protein
MDDTATTRLRQLRDCFQQAAEKLEAIPEAGLSEDGQPYIQEVAEALQSFAAWFHHLKLDNMSLFGSAYRVHVALNGLDAIADWVGLHRSQQFADDLRKHVAELVEQSEALDALVSAAFTVKRTPSEVVKSRFRRVSQAKRDAIEDGTATVATIAEHLAIRLKRIAVMAAPHSERKPADDGKLLDARVASGKPKRTPGRPGEDDELQTALVKEWLEWARAYDGDGKPQRAAFIEQRNRGARKTADGMKEWNARCLRLLSNGLRNRRRKLKKARETKRT